MAIYKVWSGASGSGTGADWANAFTTLAAGVSAATGSWDVVEVASDHIDLLTAATYYKAQNNLAIVVVDRTTGAFAEMDGTTGYIGSATSYSTGFSGPYSLFIRGLVLKGSTDSTYNFKFGDSTGSDGFNAVVEKCKFWIGGSASTSRITVGYSSGVLNCNVSFVNCTAKFGAVGQGFMLYGKALFSGLTIDPSGSSPTALIATATYGAGGVTVDSSDLSHCSGALLASQSSEPITLTVSNTKLHASVNPLATQTPANLASGEVFLYNCSKGTLQNVIGHYNAFGSTETNLSIYANDAKTYDGTNKCSIKVSSTAYATFFSPYISPWFDRAFIPASTPAAITPHMECLRDGSASAFTNSEVWPEVSYQGTADSAQATIVSGRRAYDDSAASRPSSSLDASGWTGESGTAWFGKLGPSSSITPLEAGHLRLRVCIAAANESIYLDPQWRGVA